MSNWLFEDERSAMVKGHKMIIFNRKLLLGSKIGEDYDYSKNHGRVRSKQCE